MKFGKGKKEKSYGIIGLGRFGSALAIQMAASGNEILVMDADEDRVKAMRDYTENAYITKNLDKKTLRETGVQNCDVVVVCIGEKMDMSILTTLNVKSLGVERVIAKANSTEHGEILEKLGAEVVYPERDMAIRLARRLQSSKVLNYIELSEKVDIFKIQIPEGCIGKTVLQLNLRSRYGLNIIAFERKGVIITDVTPEYTIDESDIMFVIGDYEKIERFENSRHE